MSPHAARLGIAAASLLVVLVSPAVAGPPLLCHPFEIGQARSLPWDGSSSWFHGRADYDVTRLVQDTEALLTPTTPVIVRMETIRRAAIYASLSQRVAADLVARFDERTRTNDPLALLDAALVRATLHQVSQLRDLANFGERAPAARAAVGTNDGRALLARALAARPGDPAFEFAAAIVVADKDKRAYQAHARKARSGSAQDPLLARNLHHID